MKWLLTATVVSLLLLTGPGPVQAAEIELDDVRISEGSDGGVMARIPFSGQWWSFRNGYLAQGFFGDDNFDWNASTRRYVLRAGIPDDDASPFVKYDRFVARRFGTNPQAALYELHGDAGFNHHVDPAEAASLESRGINFGWWGHCNGWAASSLAEREPHTPTTAEGIRFDVADLKGLLAEVYWGTQNAFTGKRYNDPGWRLPIYEEAVPLLQALDDGDPPDVEEYIDWYERMYRLRENDPDYRLSGSYEPEDFRSVLEWYTGWYDETYIQAYADLHPHVFHRILVTAVKNRRTGVIFDMEANEEVWNFPVHAYQTRITFVRDLAGGRKLYRVATDVHYQSDGVNYSVLGVVERTNHYTYELQTDSVGRPVGGRWTGSSVDAHPDFAWLPTFNPTGPDPEENRRVEFGKVLALLTQDHARSDARLVTMSVNGTTSDERRLGREARTVRNPLAAGGTLTLDATVAAGSGIDRVAYYRQSISRIGSSSDWQANRGDLFPIAERTGTSRSATWSRSSSGRYMLVVKGFAGNTLVSFDELVVQYSPDEVDPPADDDAFEENDSRSNATTVTGGSYGGLRCNDDDWYAVRIGAGGSLAVRIAFSHSEGDLDMQLEDGAGTLLSRSVSVTDSETVSASDLAAGTYYVRVYGYNGARADYSMTVTADGGETPTTDDAFEENDTRSSATAVTAGSYPGLRCDDDDWYAIAVGPGGGLTVRMEFSHAEGDLDLQLEDAGGTLLSRSISVTDSETVSASGLAAGTYYVRVYGYNGAQADYSMTVTIEGGGAGTDDAFEENDTRFTATPITPGSYPGLRCEDDDWFRIEAADGQLTLRIEFSHAEGDIDLYLYDSDGQEITRSWSITDNEQISVNVPAGTYYFAVNGYQGAVASYDLVVTN